LITYTNIGWKVAREDILRFLVLLIQETAHFLPFLAKAKGRTKNDLSKAEKLTFRFRLCLVMLSGTFKAGSTKQRLLEIEW
jgi:hypothetical protein